MRICKEIHHSSKMATYNLHEPALTAVKNNAIVFLTLIWDTVHYLRNYCFSLTKNKYQLIAPNDIFRISIVFFYANVSSL